ncbi:MAG: hypothetical protein H6868_02390 [Rhodospirillales bacterium]|nr:hypothetical protein [Rhodospirillales bacterium]
MDQTNKNGVGRRLADPSLWILTASNVMTMAMAFIQGWEMGPVLWVYWAQSVIIGLTNFVRMINLKEFTTKGMTMNDHPVPETSAGKYQVSFFFLFHYGFFHFVYAMLLISDNFDGALTPEQVFTVSFCVLAFASSHIYSFVYNKGQDFRHKKPSLGTIMFYPYMRIVPMHLTIILGTAMGGQAILLFMGLKTISDAGMHMVEHYLFQKPVKERLEMKD